MPDAARERPVRRSCEWCGDEHGSCDFCGRPTLARTCPYCGAFTCEVEAMHVGDAREARGLPRSPEGDSVSGLRATCTACGDPIEADEASFSVRVGAADPVRFHGDVLTGDGPCREVGLGYGTRPIREDAR